MDTMDAVRKPGLGTLYAGAWRLTAELFRLHQGQLDLHVHQSFPGLSEHGEFLIFAGDLAAHLQRQGGRVEVGLGAGQNGRVSVRSGRREGAAAESETGPTRFAWEVSLGTEEAARELVIAISNRMGWKEAGKPPSNRPTLVARLLARFLERHASDSKPWRTTPGWFDASNDRDTLCGWMQVHPELWTKLGSGLRQLSSRDQVRALRYVLLARSETPSAAARTSWSPGTFNGMVFDLKTAEATVLTHPEARIDLFSRYQANGHRLTPIVRWMENELES